MKVKELIEKLQQLDQDEKIYFENDGFPCEVEFIRYEEFMRVHVID